MKPRFDILLVSALALTLVDCRHTPSEKAADAKPVDNCLSLLDSDESLTMDTPFVATGPVITYDGEPVPAPEFRRFSMLYADVMAPRSPSAVVEAFATYWAGARLADEAQIVVTRGEVDERVAAIERRFPDDATFERFLEDSGMTRRKLSAAACRDLRLEKFAAQQQKLEVDADDPRLHRAQRAGQLAPVILETLEQARVNRTAPVPESKVTSSLTKDYATPLTGEFTGLTFTEAGWRVDFHFAKDHVMHGLDHERLMLVRGRENRVRLQSRTYPHALYLADDRVVLSAPQEQEPSAVVRVDGPYDRPELTVENYAASTWVRPLGTLPLTYMDVLRRREVREPAVTPRGKELGRRLTYACAASGDADCMDGEFSIDVLDEDQAQTWAIFQYPPVDAERVYTRHCSACHGADGAGRDTTHPPVAGTRWTTGLLGERVLIESIALGSKAGSLRGETTVKGQVYDAEVMPSYVEHLEPRQVHAVVNYVASSWGNDGPQVSEEQVIDVYCDNGYDVVYRARVDEDRMERMVDEARRSGDCGDEVRAELETLQEPVSDETKERAELLYEANCATCHGVQGNGDGPASVGLMTAPTDFTDPESWNHGRTLAAAFLSIAEGNEGTSMSPYADRFTHRELKALAQMSVAWLPEDARAGGTDEGALREYCRAETERRRLEWDRCAERSED